MKLKTLKRIRIRDKLNNVKYIRRVLFYPVTRLRKDQRVYAKCLGRLISGKEWGELLCSNKIAIERE